MSISLRQHNHIRGLMSPAVIVRTLLTFLCFDTIILGILSLVIPLKLIMKDTQPEISPY